MDIDWNKINLEDWDEEIEESDPFEWEDDLEDELEEEL